MCTVIFTSAKNKITFASLRDENPERPLAKSPETYISKNIKFLMPQDPLAGGTWVGINEFMNVIILLNGGFENHLKKEIYQKSRGQIVKELLLSVTPVIDWHLLDLSDIEPFTLIVWSKDNLFELVWDGKEKHRKILDSSVSHIWSSSTLYDDFSKNERAHLFHDWVKKNQEITNLKLLNFFKSNKDEENGFVINRNEKMKTLSYSFIELYDSQNASFDYYDLQNFNYSTSKIELVESTIDCCFDSSKFTK